MAFKFPLTPMSRRETNRIMDMVALKRAIENGGGGGGSVEFVFEDMEIPCNYTLQSGSYLSAYADITKEGYTPIGLAKCLPLATGFSIQGFTIDNRFNSLSISIMNMQNLMHNQKVLTDGTSITMNGSTPTLDKVIAQHDNFPLTISVIIVYVKNN